MEYEENYDSYEYDNRENSVTNENVDLSMKLPAKNHINKLEVIFFRVLKWRNFKALLASLQNDLEESKKNIQKLRGEFLYLGFKNNDNNTEMSNFIVNEAIKLTNDFKRLTLEENEEASKLKQQVSGLIQEKIKIHQDALVLENRVYETEKDLGYNTSL